MKPRVPTAEFRTVLPPPRTFENRLKADPSLGFYQSPEWRSLRDAVLRERGRHCARCGKEGGRVYVDHVEELRDGGAPLDRNNLQILCSSCHVVKSGEARARRFGIA
jgi:5-methylcytosine-specific restriction endonuclease McrA